MRQEKSRFVYEMLRGTAEGTEKELRWYLDSRGVDLEQMSSKRPARMARTSACPALYWVRLGR